MAIQIKITVEDAATRERLDKLTASVEDRTTLNKQLAERGLGVLENHFLRRPHNKRGWTPQNFWSQMSTASSIREVTASQATIVVGDEKMAQKVYGGTIRPKAKKYLAIPAIAEAYGNAPLSQSLKLIFGRGRKVIGLGEIEGQKRKVWFWLVKSVTQRPDPDALPPDEAFASALREEAVEYLNRLAN